MVPNVHVENMYELPRQLAGDVHESARAVALALKRAYGCDGISTRQHNEPGGNQDVWHYHLHVFPRYEGDGLYGSPHRETTPQERLPYAEQLREALRDAGAEAFSLSPSLESRTLATQDRGQAEA